MSEVEEKKPRKSLEGARVIQNSTVFDTISVLVAESWPWERAPLGRMLLNARAGSQQMNFMPN